MSKVLVIGFDAADKDLIAEWGREGLLPSFTSLMDRAVWGYVDNPRGLEAGSAWPTFYYGASPARHLQYDGTRHFDPQLYTHTNYRREDLPEPPFWERFADAGKRCAIIDAPYIHLPRVANGIAMVDWATHAPAQGGRTLRFETWPPSLAEEVTASFGPDPLGGHMCDHFRPRSAEELSDFREKLLRRIRIKTEMSLHYLRQGGWDLFATVYAECHCMGHHAWHVHDPSHPLHDPEVARRVGDPLRDVYIAADAALGRLLETVTPDTELLVYCSHGMGPGYSGTRLLDRMLVALEGRRPADRRGTATELMRKAWRGLPDGLRTALRPMQARAWKKIYNDGFQPNRAERQCFEVYANDRSAGLRINLAGREPQGKVAPGAEYEALVAQLCADLGAFVNEETGEPLIAEIVRSDEAHQGRNVGRLPDLIVTWNRNAPINAVSSPKTGRIVHDKLTFRTGDHTPVGLFFATGPRVRPGQLNRHVSVCDFAPTLAALLDVEVADSDGAPIPAIAGDMPGRHAAVG